MPGDAPAIWIKDPLAIFADGAERGIVVRDGRIAELVPAGRNPATPDVRTFDAGEHVVLPGLINTHHHFYQTLTRAVPAALDRELFPWLQALYPIWARLTPEALDLAVTLAMAELILSGCTTTTDHHYVFPNGTKTASTSKSRRRSSIAEIADRIAVMFHGRLSAPLEAAEATREKLGLLMGGAHTEQPPTDQEVKHAVGA